MLSSTLNICFQLHQRDNSGQCALVHAAVNGQLDAVSFILQCDWKTKSERELSRNEALQQSLIAAAGAGHRGVG